MASYKLREIPRVVGFVTSSPLDVSVVATYGTEAQAAADVKSRYPSCTVREAKLGANGEIHALFIYQPKAAGDPFAGLDVNPARAFVEIDPSTPTTPALWA